MPVAYVLLNVELGSEERTLNEIRKVPHVKECSQVYGAYDMIVKIEADSMAKLKETVAVKIRRVDAVRSTLTMIVTE